MSEMARSGRCVVAVDGPSGSGKSTVSRRLAGELGAGYLDTGAMYRAITWAVLRSGVDLADADAVAKVAADADLRIGTDPQGYHVTVDGVGVDEISDDESVQGQCAHRGGQHRDAQTRGDQGQQNCGTGRLMGTSGNETRCATGTHRGVVDGGVTAVVHDEGFVAEVDHRHHRLDGEAVIRRHREDERFVVDDPGLDVVTDGRRTQESEIDGAGTQGVALTGRQHVGPDVEVDVGEFALDDPGDAWQV